MAVYKLIKLRRDYAANWTSLNPVLSLGEPGFERDTGKMKIGDGTTPWDQLEYIKVSADDIVVDPEEIADIVASTLQEGPYIDIDYQDASDVIVISATGVASEADLIALSGDVANLDAALVFKGFTNPVAPNSAPLNNDNGDVWISNTSGIVDGTWTGAAGETVVVDQFIVYASGTDTWTLGGKSVGVDLSDYVLKSEFNPVKDLAEKNEQDIYALSGTTENLKLDIGALSGTVNGHSNSIIVLQSQMNSVSGSQIPDINAAIASLSGSISSVSGDFINIDADLSSLSGFVIQNSGRIDGLEIYVNDLSNSLTGISGDLDGLQLQITDNRNDIVTLSGMIVDVEGGLNTVSGNLNTLTLVVGNQLTYIQSLSGLVLQNTQDIQTLSGLIDGGLDFKGYVDPTVTGTAPSAPNNGDLYISTTSGNINTGWDCLVGSGVVENQWLIYSSDDSCFQLGPANDVDLSAYALKTELEAVSGLTVINANDIITVSGLLGEGVPTGLVEYSTGLKIQHQDTVVSVNDNGSNYVIDLTDWKIEDGHMLPISNANFDIGSAERKVRHLFLSDNSVYMGEGVLSASSGSVVLEWNGEALAKVADLMTVSGIANKAGQDAQTAISGVQDNAADIVILSGLIASSTPSGFDNLVIQVNQNTNDIAILSGLIPVNLADLDDVTVPAGPGNPEQYAAPIYNTGTSDYTVQRITPVHVEDSRVTPPLGGYENGSLGKELTEMHTDISANTDNITAISGGLIDIPNAVTFRGITDPTVNLSAPSGPVNGDMWVSNNSGLIDPSWSLLGGEPVVENQFLLYSSGLSGWLKGGQIDVNNLDADYLPLKGNIGEDDVALTGGIKFSISGLKITEEFENASQLASLKVDADRVFFSRNPDPAPNTDNVTQIFGRASVGKTWSVSPPQKEIGFAVFPPEQDGAQVGGAFVCWTPVHDRGYQGAFSTQYRYYPQEPSKAAATALSMTDFQSAGTVDPYFHFKSGYGGSETYPNLRSFVSEPFFPSSINSVDGSGAAIGDYAAFLAQPQQGFGGGAVKRGVGFMANLGPGGVYNAVWGFLETNSVRNQFESPTMFGMNAFYDAWNPESVDVNAYATDMVDIGTGGLRIRQQKLVMPTTSGNVGQLGWDQFGLLCYTSSSWKRAPLLEFTTTVTNPTSDSVALTVDGTAELTAEAGKVIINGELQTDVVTTKASNQNDPIVYFTSSDVRINTADQNTGARANTLVVENEHVTAYSNINNSPATPANLRIAYPSTVGTSNDMGALQWQVWNNSSEKTHISLAEVGCDIIGGAGAGNEGALTFGVKTANVDGIAERLRITKDDLQAAADYVPQTDQSLVTVGTLTSGLIPTEATLPISSADDTVTLDGSTGRFSLDVDNNERVIVNQTGLLLNKTSVPTEPTLTFQIKDLGDNEFFYYGQYAYLRQQNDTPVGLSLINNQAAGNANRGIWTVAIGDGQANQNDLNIWSSSVGGAGENRATFTKDGDFVLNTSTGKVHTNTITSLTASTSTRIQTETNNALVVNAAGSPYGVLHTARGNSSAAHATRPFLTSVDPSHTYNVRMTDWSYLTIDLLSGDPADPFRLADYATTAFTGKVDRYAGFNVGGFDPVNMQATKAYGVYLNVNAAVDGRDFYAIYSNGTASSYFAGGIVADEVQSINNTITIDSPSVGLNMTPASNVLLDGTTDQAFVYRFQSTNTGLYDGRFGTRIASSEYPGLNLIVDMVADPQEQTYGLWGGNSGGSTPIIQGGQAANVLIKPTGPLANQFIKLDLPVISGQTGGKMVIAAGNSVPANLLIGGRGENPKDTFTICAKAGGSAVTNPQSVVWASHMDGDQYTGSAYFKLAHGDDGNNSQRSYWNLFASTPTDYASSGGIYERTDYVFRIAGAVAKSTDAAASSTNNFITCIESTDSDYSRVRMEQPVYFEQGMSGLAIGDLDNVDFPAGAGPFPPDSFDNQVLLFSANGGVSDGRWTASPVAYAEYETTPPLGGWPAGSLGEKIDSLGGAANLPISSVDDNHGVDYASGGAVPVTRVWSKDYNSVQAGSFLVDYHGRLYATSTKTETNSVARNSAVSSYAKVDTGNTRVGYSLRSTYWGDTSVVPDYPFQGVSYLYGFYSNPILRDIRVTSCFDFNAVGPQSIDSSGTVANICGFMVASNYGSQALPPSGQEKVLKYGVRSDLAEDIGSDGNHKTFNFFVNGTAPSRFVGNIELASASRLRSSSATSNELYFTGNATVHEGARVILRPRPDSIDPNVNSDGQYYLQFDQPRDPGTYAYRIYQYPSGQSTPLASAGFGATVMYTNNTTLGILGGNGINFNGDANSLYGFGYTTPMLKITAQGDLETYSTYAPATENSLVDKKFMQVANLSDIEYPVGPSPVSDGQLLVFTDTSDKWVPSNAGNATLGSTPLGGWPAGSLGEAIANAGGGGGTATLPISSSDNNLEISQVNTKSFGFNIQGSTAVEISQNNGSNVPTIKVGDSHAFGTPGISVYTSGTAGGSQSHYRLVSPTGTDGTGQNYSYFGVTNPSFSSAGTVLTSGTAYLASQIDMVVGAGVDINDTTRAIKFNIGGWAATRTEMKIEQDKVMTRPAYNYWACGNDYNTETSKFYLHYRGDTGKYQVGVGIPHSQAHVNADFVVGNAVSGGSTVSTIQSRGLGTIQYHQFRGDDGYFNISRQNQNGVVSFDSNEDSTGRGSETVMQFSPSTEAARINYNLGLNCVVGDTRLQVENPGVSGTQSSYGMIVGGNMGATSVLTNASCRQDQSSAQGFYSYNTVSAGATLGTLYCFRADSANSMGGNLTAHVGYYAGTNIRYGANSNIGFSSAVPSGLQNYAFFTNTPGTQSFFRGNVGVGEGASSPQVAVDVHSDRIAIRDEYTPAALSSDTTGEIAWDEDYIWVRTTAGWKKSPLYAFDQTPSLTVRVTQAEYDGLTPDPDITYVIVG